MQLGMIGLGRMGANLVRRLMRGGHECVVYDVNPAAVKELAGEGATGASSLEEFVAKLTEQIPFYGQRHLVRPGLTGWAQVRYTYGASVEDAMQKLEYRFPVRLTPAKS